MSIIPCRQLLTSPLTVYVNWWGSDYNDGLSPQTAFQTIQGAVRAFTQKYDTGGYSHTIAVGDGYYNGATLSEVTGGGSITIRGNGTSTFVKGNIQCNQRRTRYVLQNLTFVPENTFAVSALNGLIELGSGLIFQVSQATTPALLVAELDGIIRVQNDFTITYTTGVLPSLVLAKTKGQVILRNIQVTAIGNLNWLVSALWAQSFGLIDARNFRHTGADPTTGLRWLIESSGVILFDAGTDILGDTNGVASLTTQSEPPVIPQAQLGFNLPINFANVTYQLT